MPNIPLILVYRVGCNIQPRRVSPIILFYSILYNLTWSDGYHSPYGAELTGNDVDQHRPRRRQRLYLIKRRKEGPTESAFYGLRLANGLVGPLRKTHYHRIQDFVVDNCLRGAMSNSISSHWVPEPPIKFTLNPTSSN